MCECAQEREREIQIHGKTVSKQQQAGAATSNTVSRDHSAVCLCSFQKNSHKTTQRILDSHGLAAILRFTHVLLDDDGKMIFHFPILANSHL